MKIKKEIMKSKMNRINNTKEVKEITNIYKKVKNNLANKKESIQK